MAAVPPGLAAQRGDEFWIEIVLRHPGASACTCSHRCPVEKPPLALRGSSSCPAGRGREHGQTAVPPQRSRLAPPPPLPPGRPDRRVTRRETVLLTGEGGPRASTDTRGRIPQGRGTHGAAGASAAASSPPVGHRLSILLPAGGSPRAGPGRARCPGRPPAPRASPTSHGRAGPGLPSSDRQRESTPGGTRDPGLQPDPSPRHRNPAEAGPGPGPGTYRRSCGSLSLPGSEGRGPASPASPGQPQLSPQGHPELSVQGQGHTTPSPSPGAQAG